MHEQIDMGTPPNIIWQGISKLCAKFHAFISLVMIKSLTHLTTSVLLRIKRVTWSKSNNKTHSSSRVAKGQMNQNFNFSLFLPNKSKISLKHVLKFHSNWTFALQRYCNLKNAYFWPS